jgi:hypothetical protein
VIDSCAQNTITLVGEKLFLNKKQDISERISGGSLGKTTNPLFNALSSTVSTAGFVSPGHI